MRPPVIDGIEEHDPTGRIERHAIISFGLPYEPEAEIRSNERAASEQDALPTSRLCSSVCGINTTGRSQGTGQVSRVLYKRR